MRTSGRWLVCVVGLAAVCCALRRQAFLDATEADVRPEPGHVIEWRGISPSPASHPLFPLRIRILKLDRPEYRRMDRIKYDVSITNVSAQPVVLPWSPLPINRRDRPASGYRHALFEFIVEKRHQQDAVAHTFVLYGAPTVNGSLKELQPSEAVVVRLPGIFSGSGFQDARNPILCPDPLLRAKVGMSLYSPDDERFKFFHEEFSDNTLPIRIVAEADKEGRCEPPPNSRLEATAPPSAAPRRGSTGDR